MRFFDEVQYLWRIGSASEITGGCLPAFRFVATGSATAALRLKSNRVGCGPVLDFVLPPLTFAEYLRFIGKEEALIHVKNDEESGGPGALDRYATNDVEALNAEFINYLNFGGYPEAVMSPTVQADTGRFIKTTSSTRYCSVTCPAFTALTISNLTACSRRWPTNWQ